VSDTERILMALLEAQTHLGTTAGGSHEFRPECLNEGIAGQFVRFIHGINDSKT
jgi:hypothetical protein